MNPNRGYRKANLPDNAKRVFEGQIFDVYQWEQELYDGSKTTFEKLVRPDTAAIIPILPDGNILLIEDSQPQREMVLTVPMGRVEEGETPEQAARRELLEETGYSVESIELFYEEKRVGKIDWIIYWFVGRGVQKVQDPVLDPGEKITPRVSTFEEFIAGSGGDRAYKELPPPLLEARGDAQKLEELKKRFFG